MDERTVDDVLHSAFSKTHYDPEERHKRYLRQRQLKGRQGGGGDQGGGFRPPGSVVTPSTHVNRTQATQAASSARQVAQIQGRLTALKAHLSELLAKQKASSSSDSKSSDSKASKSGDSTKGPDKPQTAKQKAAAKEALAKAQKERAKDQKATPDKKPTELPLADQISKTRAVISDVEAKLKTVKDQARNQTA